MKTLNRIAGAAALALLATHAIDVAAEVPHVLGVRLGMTPSEVKTTLRAKGARSFGDAISTVTYASANGGRKELPASEFQGTQMYSIGNAQTNSVTVHYSPLHKAERVVIVERNRQYEEGSRPTVETLTADLRKEYGAPALVKTYGTTVYLIWSLDAAGSPRAGVSQAVFSSCLAGNVLSLQRNDAQGRDRVQVCGEQFLSASLIVTGPDKFVSALLMSAVDFGAIFAAQAKVDALIKAHADAEAAMERAKAAARKSDL